MNYPHKKEGRSGMEAADPWQGLEEDLHQQWELDQSRRDWVSDYEREEQKMGRMANQKGGDFQDPPTGTTVGRCVRLWDLGTQTGEYQGKVTNRKQIFMGFELPNELMDAGEDGIQKPFIIAKFYTNSLNEKATLRIHLEAWRGKAFTDEELDGFDLMSVLGKACTLSIVSKDGGGVKIGSVSSIMKGVTCPPQFNEESSFWIEEWNQDVFDNMPGGIKAIIQKSPEYRARSGEHTSGGSGFEDMASDIPF